MKRTIRISETIVLPVQAESLWLFVEDYANDISWRQGLIEMTPDPIGPPRMGTNVHEVVKKAGSTYVTNSTVIEAGDRSYRFSGLGDSGGVEGGRCVVTTSDGEAAFTYDIVLHLNGINALVAPFIRLIMTRGLRSDLRHLAAEVRVLPGLLVLMGGGVAAGDPAER